MDRSPVNPVLFPWTRRLEKLWNTYVRIPLPRRGSCAMEHWAGQKVGEGHGPDKFVRLDPASAVLLDEVAARAAGPDARILDLGCNVGRNMNALFERGFKNLHGVDVQKDAFEHMERVFPAMKAAAHLHNNSYQGYLPGVPDIFFDVVYSQAAVEFVPPSFHLVRQVARVARSAVVFMIHENGHSYPRLWETEFARAGFFLTKLLRPAWPGETFSLMVFLRADGGAR